LLITPIIFGTSNLDEKSSAVPLEMFIVLVGIILVIPAFLPEQQKEIKELVEAKYTGSNAVYIIRILLAVFSLFLLISGFCLIMLLNGCSFAFLPYILGTFTGSIFLGALGLLSYGISNNTAVGYMLPIIYFIFNLFGGRSFWGKLYLFSMSQGSYEEKYWLFGAALVILTLTLLLKAVIRKKR
jgi:hypothetical protein